MQVKAKMFCNQKEEAHEGTFNINLTAVTSGSEENKQFFKYTPSGNVSLQTINVSAAQEFEIGKEYYVTFKQA